MIRSNLLMGLWVSVIAIQLGCKPESAYQTPPPPKVTIAKPNVDNVPIFLIENGQTEAVEQAVVQAQVRGILQEIKFEPNDEVTEGTPLFLIEQQEYAAAVESAKATLSSARAALKTAQAAIDVADAKISAADAAIKVSEAEFNRMENLKTSNAVSQSEYDAAKAQLDVSKAAMLGEQAEKKAKEADVANAQAQVEKAIADLAQADLDLTRTVVVAPIGGRITRTIVKRGNLVDNGSDLVEIVKNDPIWANFNISERFLLTLENNYERHADETINPKNVKVELQRSGDVGFPFQGHLDYYDPKINQNTGTLQLRAIFDNKPNADGNLLPGMFVRVRIQIGALENALLIPERAVSRDEAGTFVYIVDNENKAVRKNVQLGPKQEERVAVEAGLEQGDSVIIDGIQRVRPGAEVDPG